MFRFFRRARKQSSENNISKQIKQEFEKQLNLKKYTLSPSVDLPTHISKNKVEKLIKSGKIAPIYPAEDAYCSDDKECMICLQTVRQGMNALECCGGKRFICSYCLLHHPKFKMESVQVYCDICYKLSNVNVTTVDIDKEVNKIINKPTDKEISIEQLLKEQHEKDDPLKNVRQDVKNIFGKYGVGLRNDVDEEVYNSIDISIITDAGMAEVIMASLL